MRFFYAVAADAEVQAAAVSAVGLLQRARGDYRWVEPRDMHVTLRFIGETPEAELPKLEALMRLAAAASAPFEVVYGRVGAFESEDDPRVVWIGLDGEIEPMKRLAELLGRDEPRPYAPHLTLGRRRGATPAGFGAAMRAMPALGLRWRVQKISLYASKPAPSGPGHVYEILSEAELSGSRA